MENLGNTTLRQDAAPLLQSLIEGERLHKWQKRFCEVANVFVCCVDSRGTAITEFDGKADEIEAVKKAIDREQLQAMFRRVSESTLEDQAIETTAYPNFRMAVISVRLEEHLLINWVVCGVLSDWVDQEEYSMPPLQGFSSVISQRQFYSAVDALRDFSAEMFAYKLNLIGAQAESRRSHYSEQEMGESLKRAEALTEVVQLLENDNAIEGVMQQLLAVTGGFLELSEALVCRFSREGRGVDVLCGWQTENALWQEPELHMGKNVCPFFMGKDQTLVLSYNSAMNPEEKEEMQKLGLKATAVLPVQINGSIGMYACFQERVKDRVWKLEEIKFLNDSVKVLQSILTRRIQKNSLASSYVSLETILDNVGSAVYVQDITSGKNLFSNKNMSYTFHQELKDGSIHLLLDGVVTGEKGSGEIYYDKKACWYDIYYTHIKWVDGRPVLLYALYDITEKKIYQRKIEQQAYTDFLTGLYNRMCCERDLAQYVDEARQKGKKGALLYLDLDDFKHINDGLGHQYGDVLLKAIAHSIQRVDGIENTCYRMGGDEFVIIVPPRLHSGLNEIVEGIKNIFTNPWFLKDADYYCTMSMGIVEFPIDGSEIHDLIKKADMAMYEAKKGGKNRVARYSSNIDTQSGRRLNMEKNMRDAASEGYKEFQVYFQPIIDIQKKGLPCTGAEALIRWNSQEMGFVPPLDFIPLAEYLGLINPIGNYVLEEACRYCSGWNRNGYPDYKVNVNLSVVQLLQPDIVDIVRQTLEKTGLVPQNLTLEVTESLAINDMDRMKEILGKIKELGVRIALDDFGTGYSSLNHIREIPFDVIKVDQSFIKDLEQDDYAKSFIRMVGELAEAIGVNLCVEGVETQNQYKILSEMQVSMIQGYYFDKPMPREEFERKYIQKLTM